MFHNITTLYFGILKLTFKFKSKFNVCKFYSQYYPSTILQRMISVGM